jgi:hypothetical protein
MQDRIPKVTEGANVLGCKKLINLRALEVISPPPVDDRLKRGVVNND